jgi:cytochrome c oxidase subunit II
LKGSRWIGCVSLLSLAAGCRYVTLDRASPEATRITNLHWLAFWILGAVWFAVMGFLAAGLRRRARSSTPEGEQRRARTIVAATIVSAVLLLIVLTASVLAGRSIVTPPGPDVLEIEITGHQWWWEVRYPSASPDEEVTTANEIHVPVGRPVRLKLFSNDVIHSFWIPNVQGKKDLLPGRPTTHLFRVERAGTFRGQCAEFCGYQHAHMGLLLVAERPPQFEAWLSGQRRTAIEPEDSAKRHGREVFLSGPCVLCHTIRGAGAFGHKGPDLTHLASRQMIASATLTNTPGNLAGWIIDAQRIKPGNRMPPNTLAGSDLTDLVSYLGSLQ